MPGDETSPFGPKTITTAAAATPRRRPSASTRPPRPARRTPSQPPRSMTGSRKPIGQRRPARTARWSFKPPSSTTPGTSSQISRPFFSGSTPALTSYTRDALRRLTSVTEPDGIPRHPALRNDQDVVDPRGNLSRFVHDAYGKIVEEHQSLISGADQVTTYQYDSVGNPSDHHRRGGRGHADRLRRARPPDPFC